MNENKNKTLGNMQWLYIIKNCFSVSRHFRSKLETFL